MRIFSKGFIDDQKAKDRDIKNLLNSRAQGGKVTIVSVKDNDDDEINDIFDHEDDEKDNEGYSRRLLRRG